jgi:hypothetical protein
VRETYALPPRVRNFNRDRAKWDKAKRVWARAMGYKAQAKERNSPEMERLAIHNLKAFDDILDEIGIDKLVIGYEPEEVNSG